MEKWLKDVLPVKGVEHDCILSKMGDVTVVYEATLPEIFTLSDQEYEAFHQAWIKAVKVLPKQSVFHKQDWFVDSAYAPDFTKDDTSFLTRSSERFFNERPFLDHRCYILLTKKPASRKASTSLFSTLLRNSIVPEETLKPQLIQDFLDSCGQFKRILEDSGFVQLKRLGDDELQSQERTAGLIERYCYLSEAKDELLVKDIHFKDGIRIGDQYAQLYTLSNAADLPALCGSRIRQIKQSSVLVLLPCSGNCFPVIIFITSMYSSRIHRRLSRNWKASGSDFSLYRRTQGRTRSRGMRPMIF